ncbi:MAG: hypothetical protein HUK05_00200 [Prevotella sp.]|nr:hypothetical protein [Prevotella sp.]MCF0208722.1 hypothetical protein [Bacteroidaceae bacterium]
MKTTLRIANAITILFRPFYLPLAGLAALFLFSVLNILPYSYRLFIIVIVWLFTVILPQVLIAIYHKTHGLQFLPFVSREHRSVPYAISIICYFSCYWLLATMNAHHTIKAVLIAALVVQMVCALINIKQKISTHMAGIGSFLGGLLAFSYIFYFNPVWWFCVVNLVAGIIGTCRMILRQHTLQEIIYGYLVGFVGALVTILLV